MNFSYKIDLNFLQFDILTLTMAFLTKLRKPEGFADSNKFAINPMTGDLLPWKWPSLNPEDFCIDENNDLWHDCDDKTTFSRIVRNGTKANNFFQKDPLPPPSLQSQQTINVGDRKKNKHYVSIRGNWHSRKRKFKKRKYKNSKMRPKKQWNKKRKKLKKTRGDRQPLIIQNLNKCKFCKVGGETPTLPTGCPQCPQLCIENIFRDPIEKYSCDFCQKYFDGPRHRGLVCEYCLISVHKCNFCEDCKKNLGDWNPDWRMRLNIPQSQHPARCKCEECFQYRWLHPCSYCGQMDHTAAMCPWGAGEDPYLTRDYLQEQLDYENHYGHIEDEYADEQEAIIRDDYLFGW